MPRKWKTKAEKDEAYVPQITKLLYPMIGNRIRQRRKDMGKSLMDISADMGIDYTLLSRIERGLISTKNPYLLSAMQITAISGRFGIDAADLIWGTREERATLVKMVCASLLLNGNGNPFHDRITAAQYERLHMEYCSDYERTSNLILKQLLLNSDYDNCFFHHLQECAEYNPQKFRVLVEGYLLNKGDFSDFLLEKQYESCFATAFSDFWARVEGEYLEFFEQEYFKVRGNDNSPFYAITDRYSVDDERFGKQEDGKMGSIDAYRGDCYTCTVSMRLQRNFTDSDVPVNEIIIDPNTWKDNYSGYNTTSEDEWLSINRGDVNTCPIGS